MKEDIGGNKFNRETRRDQITSMISIPSFPTERNEFTPPKALSTWMHGCHIEPCRMFPLSMFLAESIHGFIQFRSPAGGNELNHKVCWLKNCSVDIAICWSNQPYILVEMRPPYRAEKSQRFCCINPTFSPVLLLKKCKFRRVALSEDLGVAVAALTGAVHQG